jgi:hypothetical protein
LGECCDPCEISMPTNSIPTAFREVPSALAR